MSLVPIPIQTVNNVPLYLKFAVACVCVGLWGYFAISKQTDTTGLLEFVKMILAGLAGHLLSTSNQPKQVLPFQSN